MSGKEPVLASIFLSVALQANKRGHKIRTSFLLSAIELNKDGPPGSLWEAAGIRSPSHLPTGRERGRAWRSERKALPGSSAERPRGLVAQSAGSGGAEGLESRPDCCYQPHFARAGARQSDSES